MRLSILFATCLLLIFAVTGSMAQEISVKTQPPVVVKTVPESGSLDVSPSIGEIKVVFSKDMLFNSMSCVALTEATFPSLNGKLHFEKDKRTLVISVKLEPGRTYAIWLNNDEHKNFKDLDGLSAVPYLLIFETKK
jgi:RNA polymerase sigma-70 factor (ECF subfamily)